MRPLVARFAEAGISALFCQYIMLTLEAFCCMAKSFLIQEFAITLSLTQREEPIPGKLLSACKAAFLGADTVFLPPR